MTTAAGTPRPRFDAKIAAIWAASVASLVLLVAVVLGSMVSDSARAAELGRSTPGAVLSTAALTFALSFLVQTRRWVVMAILAGTVSCIAVLAARETLREAGRRTPSETADTARETAAGTEREAPPPSPPPAPPLPLEAADRAPLEVVEGPDGRYLQQAHLGFRIRHPGESFEPLADPGGTRPRSQRWVLVSQAEGRSMMVQVLKVPATARRSFESYLHGFTHPRDVKVTRIVKQEVSWTDLVHEARAEIVTDTGQSLLTRGVAYPLAAGGWLEVYATLVSTAPARDWPVLDSLAPLKAAATIP